VTSGYAPLSVQFTDFSQNVTSTNWDFGDGSNSTDQNPEHTYSAAGNYTVNLIVSNTNGTDSKSAQITVSEKPVLPVANFSSGGTNVSAPVTVQVGNLSQNAITINWNIGSKLPVTNFSSSGTNVSAPVTVQVGNLSQNATTINWNIGSKLPVTNFSSSGTNVSAPVTVQIGNLSQNATTIIWNIF
jgi:PKD repeat protein